MYVAVDLAFLHPGQSQPPALPLATRTSTWVEEWLPQMITFLTLVLCTPLRSDSWPSARLWSRRVRHVMFSAV